MSATAAMLARMTDLAEVIMASESRAPGSQLPGPDMLGDPGGVPTRPLQITAIGVALVDPAHEPERAPGIMTPAVELPHNDKALL
jgi:hypothetical protein